MDSKAIRVALVAVLVVCSVFVAATLPASASATADNFGVEDASGFKNTNVLVPVNITNVHSEPIVGIEFEFLYDSSVINLAEIQKGALISQWSDPDKKGTEGDYVIAIVGDIPNAITNGSTGSVVVLNFSITGEPGETSPMNLTNIKLVNKTFDETGTASPKNGTFKVPDITNVTTPEIPEEPSPISSGHVLNWTNKVVMLSFRRIDPGSSGINYTNLSASPSVNARISNNSWTWDVTLTEDNYTVLKNETIGDTFNVTISDECDTTIYYYSVDKNGTANVEVTKNLTVRIDRTKPTYSWIDRSTNGTTGETALVNVSASDNIAITVYNITTDGINHTMTKDGNYYTYSIPIPSNSIADIVYRCIFSDVAGNSNITDHTTISVADNDAPTIVSVNLSTNETTTGLPITVTVNATDNVGVTSVTAKGVEFTQQDSGDIWIGNITAVKGTNVIVNVTAIDAVGNVAYDNTTTYNAMADNEKTVINSVSLSPTEVTAGESITVTVIATDNVGIETVTADSVSLSLTSGTATSGTWTGTITAASTSGSHTVTVIAYDEAGNNATDTSKSYTVSVAAPAIRVGGGGRAAPRDTDGDGISDIDEMLAGTDWKDPCDPCDPNPECAACLAIRSPAPTPTPPVTSTPTPAVTPTLPPAVTPTPAPVPAAVVPPVIPWFWIIIAIVVAVINVSVVYVLRRKT